MSKSVAAKNGARSERPSEITGGALSAAMQCVHFIRQSPKYCSTFGRAAAAEQQQQQSSGSSSSSSIIIIIIIITRHSSI